MIIVGISGKAESGKDTFTEIVTEMLTSFDPGIRIERIRFADKLKEAAALIFDLVYEEMETPEGKRMPLEHFGGLTPREILQKLGTDVARKIFPDIWVWNVQRTLWYLRRYGVKSRKELVEATSHQPVDFVFVTDVRFPNEVSGLREEGAILVRLERPGHYIPQHDHPSETALDGVISEFDYVYSCVNVEELKEAAKEFTALLIDKVKIPSTV